MHRELFPALKRYAYLNAAASSPLATPVAEAAIAHLRETEQRGDVGFPAWLAFKEDLRARLAKFMGAKASQVAFTPSTSMGFSVVAELFRRRGIREVLTFESEFPSTTIPFLNLGISLKVVKGRPDGTYRLDDVEAALRSSTGAVVCSLVQFASGFLVDLNGLSTLCRVRQLPLAINVAQALGQVPVDAGLADFVCGTSHKWMMGGFGTGIFCIREGWLEDLGLPWSGWFSPPESLRWQTFPGTQWVDDLADGVTTRREAAALEAGGGNWAQLYSLGAALELIEGVGIDAIHRHDVALQGPLRAGLEQRGFKPNAPVCTGICVVRVEGDPLAAVRALLKHDVVCTPRGGGVRFSTHLYNDESDVERALLAIDGAGVKPA
jgi:cysteine desulfurase/selenocysteine lyase